MLGVGVIFAWPAKQIPNELVKLQNTSAIQWTIYNIHRKIDIQYLANMRRARSRMPNMQDTRKMTASVEPRPARVYPSAEAVCAAITPARTYRSVRSRNF